MMSMLASPRSQSTTRIFFPALARVVARLMVTKVLPTPPLPLVTDTMRGFLFDIGHQLEQSFPLRFIHRRFFHRPGMVAADAVLARFFGLVHLEVRLLEKIIYGK